MQKLRILAIMVLILIALDFVYMIVSLVMSNYPAFFIGGGVLVGLLILGFVLKKGRERIRSLQKDEEDAD